MTAATIETPRLRRDGGQPGRIVRQPRPGRGSARTVRPVARSIGGVAAPEVQPRGLRQAGARSCAVAVHRPMSAPVATAAAGWRLTTRGIAVVMIAGALLVAAAVTVITATALTVTSDDYRPAGSAVARP